MVVPGSSMELDWAPGSSLWSLAQPGPTHYCKDLKNEPADNRLVCLSTKNLKHFFYLKDEKPLIDCILISLC